MFGAASQPNWCVKRVVHGVNEEPPWPRARRWMAVAIAPLLAAAAVTGLSACTGTATASAPRPSATRSAAPTQVPAGDPTDQETCGEVSTLLGIVFRAGYDKSSGAVTADQYAAQMALVADAWQYVPSSHAMSASVSAMSAYTRRMPARSTLLPQPLSGSSAR